MYPILDPQVTPLSVPAPGLCAMAVMSKAPRPGRVKTRLSPPLTLEQTAALNVCFLRDTTAHLASIPDAACLVCYTPVGEEALFDGLLPEGSSLIAQQEGGFGERLFGAARDILACGFSAVCLIDSDSPTVPASAFRQAVAELNRPGDRVVLGPSHDGGYYLIGLKQPHTAPFQDITWSTGSVAEETRARCRQAGLDLVELPLWYDVDDAHTLAVLERELLHGERPPFAREQGYPAPNTQAWLQARQSTFPETTRSGGA